MVARIQEPRDLRPDIALSVAAGVFLLGRPGEEERNRLEAAAKAARAAGVFGTAAALCAAAEAHLAGIADSADLRAALAAFIAPFCPRKGRDPDHRGLANDELPLLSNTHAARVAAALENDR